MKNNKSVDVNSESFPTVYLKDEEDFLTIKTSALNYHNASSQAYRYRLSGLNSDWVELNDTRIINLFGLTPLGVNVTNNIAVTFSLAIITYLITTFTANKHYWKHIFWMPGVPVPMKLILAPIELLGTIIKPFSLMIRLYANITAGHVVLMSIIGLMFIFKNWIGSSLSFGLAFAIALLELLVAALQAYIFTMLSALYFGSAVEEHHDH